MQDYNIVSGVGSTHIVMDYGLRLKELMSERKRTQKDIAGVLGVHPMTVSRWIRSRYPELESVERICNLLGVSLVEFFGGSDSPLEAEVRRIVRDELRKARV